ncbi:MAG TPA: sugar isomerase domain-containing protein [Actinomycetes bacterium]|nr:sugar isomerase domain-containing protein [Actinomycetes bacterium]
MFDRYFEAAGHTLGEVAASQAGPLEVAARLVADCVAGGGVLHLFGSGHAQLLALDAYARAGGLACVNPILDPALSPAAGIEVALAERTVGHAAAILEAQDLRPGEVVLVASNSGVNPAPVEVALGCRDRGLAVVALTNFEQARATAPRHPSGARLHELADVVIDNRCPHGDTALELASGERVGPLTTVVGAAVVAALAARVAELVAERGQRPPVLVSQNLDGRAAAEANAELLRPYRERLGQAAGPAAAAREARR